MSKTYYHEGGSYGDFAFLEEVLEEDKIISLEPPCYTTRPTIVYWKREKVGPFCKQNKYTPTTYLYERLKDRYIPPGSKLDDVLCQVVNWAEREIKKLGHNLVMKD